MGNPPLAQWQIDHIRKMQEEMGLPDTEEVTMDENLVGGLQGGLPQSETANDAAAGALSEYKDPNVQRAQTAYDALAKEQMDRYTALEKALTEKRYAPSFSERMYQLSAALFAPTTTRGFSGTMGNVMPVLQAQEKAQREGEITRREALEQLDKDRFAQRVGLAKQDVTTALALAKLEAMKSKPPTMKSVIIENNKAFDPISGAPIVQPNEIAWADLVSDPSQSNYDDFIQEFGPRFAEQAMRIVNYARRGK